jgi:hypothetical protein
LKDLRAIVLEPKPLVKIAQYSAELTDLANLLDGSVLGTFNGTEFVVDPGMSSDVAADRWYSAYFGREVPEKPTQCPFAPGVVCACFKGEVCPQLYGGRA